VRKQCRFRKIFHQEKRLLEPDIIVIHQDQDIKLGIGVVKHGNKIRIYQIFFVS